MERWHHKQVFQYSRLRRRNSEDADRLPRQAAPLDHSHALPAQVDLLRGGLRRGLRDSLCAVPPPQEQLGHGRSDIELGTSWPRHNSRGRMPVCDRWPRWRQLLADCGEAQLGGALGGMGLIYHYWSLGKVPSGGLPPERKRDSRGRGQQL